MRKLIQVIEQRCERIPNRQRSRGPKDPPWDATLLRAVMPGNPAQQGAKRQVALVWVAWRRGQHSGVNAYLYADLPNKIGLIVT